MRMLIYYILILLLVVNQLNAQLIIDREYYADDEEIEDLAIFHFLGLENSLSINQYNLTNNNDFISLNHSLGFNYYFNLIRTFETIKYDDLFKGKTFSSSNVSFKGSSLPYLKLGYKYSTLIISKTNKIENNIQFDNTANYRANVFNIDLFQSIFWVRDVGRFFLFAGYSYHSLDNNSSITSIAENLNKEEFTLSGYENTDINYIKKRYQPITNMNKLSFGIETYFNIKIADNYNEKYGNYFNHEYNFLRLHINLNTNYNLNYKENNLQPFDYSLNINLSYPLPLFNLKSKY